MEPVACSTDEPAYREIIETFIFRADDGITIPKEVREAAYEIAIDVVIRSVIKDTYKNYECSPPDSFYGYAAIVQQDCLDLKIPLRFPRQRIYYGRVVEAFVEWSAMHHFERTRNYFDSAREVFAAFAEALGVELIPTISCCALPAPVWRELPIREVYVNVPYGTQYEIEVSYLVPLGWSDECRRFFDGVSQQVDGDKDDGLPPNGTAPNQAQDPLDPFKGLDPPTSDSDQGSFSNSKVVNLGDRDPANEPKVPHSCFGGVCVETVGGTYPSRSACEAALIQGGNWKVRYKYYDPLNGCSAITEVGSYASFTNPNDVLEYADVVPTTTSCVGTGATQGNFKRNGVVFSSPSSLSDVEFFFETFSTCP